MVFLWRLSDGKSPQVSRTLLSILSVFNNPVVWMVSTHPPTSKSSRPFNNLLVTVPKVPIPISIIVTFIFHSVFNSLARSRYYLSFHILLVLFCGLPGQQSRHFFRFFFFETIYLLENYWYLTGIFETIYLCSTQWLEKRAMKKIQWNIGNIVRITNLKPYNYVETNNYY